MLPSRKAKTFQRDLTVSAANLIMSLNKPQNKAINLATLTTKFELHV